MIFVTCHLTAQQYTKERMIVVIIPYYHFVWDTRSRSISLVWKQRTFKQRALKKISSTKFPITVTLSLYASDDAILDLNGGVVRDKLACLVDDRCSSQYNRDWKDLHSFSGNIFTLWNVLSFRKLHVTAFMLIS